VGAAEEKVGWPDEEGGKIKTDWPLLIFDKEQSTRYENGK